MHNNEKAKKPTKLSVSAKQFATTRNPNKAASDERRIGKVTFKNFLEKLYKSATKHATNPLVIGDFDDIDLCGCYLDWAISVCAFSNSYKIMI